MAKEKEILRLRSLGMSQKAIMSVVHCASRKIKSTYEKADELSITYELIKDKTDDEIEEIFGNKKEVIYYHERPDYDYVIILLKLTNHSDYADQLFRYP